MSLADYYQAVAAGQRVYLPNPQGQCDLSGTRLDQSLTALDSCFAAQAAR
jgi:hypothetical protein